MLRISLVLPLLLCMAIACTPKPVPTPASGKTPVARQGKRLPKALSRSPGFRALLERIPTGQSRNTRGAIAISSWRRVFSLSEGALRQVRRGSNKRFDKLAEAFLDRELRNEGVLIPRTAKQLSSWGIADGPAAIYGVGEPVLYYTIDDEKRFRAAWKSLFGGGSWSDREQQGRALSVLSDGTAKVFCAFPSPRQAVCCPHYKPDPLYAVLESSPSLSLWAALDAKARKRIDGDMPPHGVGWFADRYVTATALLRIEDGAILLDSDVGGMLLSRFLTKLSSAAPPSALLDDYRALGTQDRVYLRVPKLVITKLAGQLTSILPGVSGLLTGEILIVTTAASALPCAFVGVQDARGAHKAIAALGRLPRTSGGQLKTSATKVAGSSAAVEIEYRATAATLGPPQRFTVAAVGSNLLVGEVATLEAQLRALSSAKKAKASSWPALGADHAPLLAAELALDDPVVGVWPLIQSALSQASAGKQLLPIVALGRYLAAQLYDARVAVSTTGDGLRVSTRVRSRYRGTAADKGAEALWRRALTSRDTDLAEYQRLSKQITAQFPKSRYAAALQRPPGLLVALTGLQSAIALPAFARYQQRAATVEATESLDKLKSASRSYFQSDRYDKKANLLPKRFPKGRTGWVPARPCCRQPDKKCQPKASTWNKAPWKQLYFRLADPHRFQYRYRASGKNQNAKVVLEARADLDCDGKYSSYKLLGEIDAENRAVFKGPIITDELE